MKTQYKTMLGVWLWTNRVTQVELARGLGISKQRVNDWVSGRKVPGKNNALRISVLTQGQVSVIDLLFPEQVDPKRLVVDNHFIPQSQHQEST
jgi:DNA-binding transcriptional regulator YdaS (Cro superfamily)